MPKIMKLCLHAEKTVGVASFFRAWCIIIVTLQPFLMPPRSLAFTITVKKHIGYAGTAVFLIQGVC